MCGGRMAAARGWPRSRLCGGDNPSTPSPLSLTAATRDRSRRRPTTWRCWELEESAPARRVCCRSRSGYLRRRWRTFTLAQLFPCRHLLDLYRYLLFSTKNSKIAWRSIPLMIRQRGIYVGCFDWNEALPEFQDWVASPNSDIAGDLELRP